MPPRKSAKSRPLTAEEIEKLDPIYHGPTWKKNPDGSWLLPDRTLGWQIAAWCAEYLLDDDGNPWKFTLEQLRFLLWWYAVDETGRFIYRRGVLQRLKGWGKDPLLAVICLVEFVGPSRFSHFNSRGVPVGVSHPRAWVQVAAVSKEQTKNTMTLLPGLMSDKLIATYDIKPGKELLRAMGGRKMLEAVTSSYRALEGGRSTFVVMNETQHWISGNNGHQMYETIHGNVTKRDSRYLAITNAYLPGEDSVAEKMREAYDRIAAGKAVDVGFLYDSVEAHPKTPLSEEALRIVLPKIRGDAVWLNVESIIQSIHDVTISPARSRRMWLNQIVADEDAVYGPADWVDLVDEDALLEAGDEIVLGFDGGKTDDATALVAIRIRDMCAFVLGVWEKPDGPEGDGWEVPREQVDSRVHEAFRIYRVRAFYADVALWESYVYSWSVDYASELEIRASVKSPIGWDMRGSLRLVTLAHERLMASVIDKKLSYDGNATLRRHALNARRRINNYGISFGKESRESPRKVDAYAALMLAHEALYDLQMRGREEDVDRGGFL